MGGRVVGAGVSLAVGKGVGGHSDVGKGVGATVVTGAFVGDLLGATVGVALIQ